MKDYLVQWEINITADSPREAAQQAWHSMQSSGSTACVFDVIDEKGSKVRVDLMEDEE